MTVPLYKELELAYNEPYWYRAHNGLRTLAQAIQVRDYYNKTNLPPYDHSTTPAMSTDSLDWSAERDGQTGQDNQTTILTTMAPNLCIITLDQDMEKDRQDSRRTTLVHHANPTASISRDERQWQQDACTLLEMDYVQKYYEKAILTWLPIERYQGLCTGQLLHIALLEAVARAQLRPTWKGMEFLDITTLIYPLDGIACSVTNNRARRNIQTTEAMFFLHPTPMHYNAILAIKQAMKVTLIWCDSLNRDGQPALDRYSQYYHFLEGDVDWTNRKQRFQPERRYTSNLEINTIIPTPALPRQENGTDCGIFTLLYQATLHAWYGTAAGHELTEERISELVSALQLVTQMRAHAYRQWLRINMHTWWNGKWEDVEQVTPTLVHHQNLERRRQQRLMAKQAKQQEHTSNGTSFSRSIGNEHSASRHSPTLATVPKQTDVCTEQTTLMNIGTPQVDSGARQGDIAKESVNLAVKDKWPIPQVSSRAMGPHLTGGNTIEAAPRRHSKRILTDLEADKAATEITDLVEQEGHHSAVSKRRLLNSEQGKEHIRGDYIGFCSLQLPTTCGTRGRQVNYSN